MYVHDSHHICCPDCNSPHTHTHNRSYLVAGLLEGFGYFWHVTLLQKRVHVWEQVRGNALIFHSVLRQHVAVFEGHLQYPVQQTPHTRLITVPSEKKKTFNAM